MEGPAHRLGGRGVVLKLRALEIRVQVQVQQWRAFVFPEATLGGFGDLGEGRCSREAGTMVWKMGFVRWEIALTSKTGAW